MATYSAAIPILRPPTGPPSTNTSPTSTAAQLPLSPSGKRNKQLCRNVLIYGQCRFEDKGCLYGHDLVRRALPHPPRGPAWEARSYASSPHFILAS